MKIEINNVYQKKSISKVKIGIVIAIFIIILAIVVWRLYYEKVQTTNIDSFAEFIGLTTILENINNTINLNSDDIKSSFGPDVSSQDYTTEGEALGTHSYIPNFTEDSLNNISKIYSLADDSQKRVYLTFDDGPSSDATTLVLDVLKEENIYATFFVLGNRVEQNPDILKRIYEEGHYIANHGYSHVYSKIYENVDTVINEYNKCEEAIQKALGIPEYSTHLFRFPGGSVGGPYDYMKRECLESFKQNNIAILDWNCLTRDSEGNFSKEEQIQNFMNTCVGKSSIVILMHDANGKVLVADVLKEVITYLKNEGYEFGNMRELIG